MRVYLDTCVWLRLYDDQRQAKIREEAHAAIGILEACERGEVVLAASALVREEMEGHLSGRKREAAGQLAVCRLEAASSPDAIRLARELVRSMGLSPEDALHLSLAAGGVDAFLTCDGETLERASMIHNFLAARGISLEVENPVGFVERWLKPRK